MITDLKEVLARSSATILQDAAGAVSLAVLLVMGLSLPSVF
jgi:hypothetical protein